MYCHFTRYLSNAFVIRIIFGFLAIVYVLTDINNLSPFLQVNLPAHLVIIKSTMQYVKGVFEEYAESQILQMTGRAGRPQVYSCTFNGADSSVSFLSHIF